MLGYHGTAGLDRVYYHARQMELAVDYLRAVQALTVTDEGLLLIELEKIRGELLMAMEKIAIMKRGEKARAGADELHDTDSETVQTNRAIKKLWKVLEDITARLNSLDKGRQDKASGWPYHFCLRQAKFGGSRAERIDARVLSKIADLGQPIQPICARSPYLDRTVRHLRTPPAWPPSYPLRYP